MGAGEEEQSFELEVDWIPELYSISREKKRTYTYSTGRMTLQYPFARNQINVTFFFVFCNV